MNLGSRWNVIYNKLRNYRYDHWLITVDSVTLCFLNVVLSVCKFCFVNQNRQYVEYMLLLFPVGLNDHLFEKTLHSVFCVDLSKNSNQCVCPLLSRLVLRVVCEI